jgi:aspartate/methionine/tyrosine aminotransferase
MVEMSCEMHDQAAAGSQFVTHLTGRMLAQLELHSTPINTKGFETLLTLVDNTCKDSFDLFLALYKCNPAASAQLAGMQQALSSVTAQLTETPQSKLPLTDANLAIRFSDFVNRIKPSGTGATHAKAIELKRQGVDIITTLTVGEPDFPPPKPILDAVKLGVDTGMTRYTPVAGQFELKQAIAEDYTARKNVSYDAATEVLITHGGKQAIFMAVLSLCHPGDEVIIPAPYWTSYPDIVALSSATPVFVDRDPANDYIMTPQQLEQALTPRTRMIILCNPCNPTGATYSREELEALAAVLRKPEFAHVWVIADEIYERLTYDGLEHVSFASLDGMLPRTLLVNGFAKGYAMTGFRLGWLGCANREVIKACAKLQSQLNSCACSISQYAGIAALKDVDEAMLRPLYQELERKRDEMVQALRKIPNIVCPVPRGAFYVFPDVSFYLGKGLKSNKTGKLVNTATQLCEYLIEEHGLALPAGDAFGGAFGVRFSYATTFQDIQGAVQRFSNGLAGLV